MNKSKYDVDVCELPVSLYESLYDIQSGVYFLFSEKYGELLYIGKSKNVRKRIDRHIENFKDLRFYTRGLDRYNLSFKVISVPKENLLSIEAFFIDKYRPPMNSTGKICGESYQDWIYQRMLDYDAFEKATANTIQQIQRNQLYLPQI